MVDWCCMYKRGGKTIDHLVIYCEVVRELWVLIFCLFSIEWVMPRRVVELLASWRGQLGSHGVLEA